MGIVEIFYAFIGLFDHGAKIFVAGVSGHLEETGDLMHELAFVCFDSLFLAGATHSGDCVVFVALSFATSLKNGFGAVVAAPIEYEPCIDASAIEFLDELKIGLIIKHNMASP